MFNEFFIAMATNNTNNSNGNSNNNINTATNNNGSNHNNNQSVATTAEPIIPSSSSATNPATAGVVSFALSKKKSSKQIISSKNTKPQITFQGRHDEEESSSCNIATLALQQSQERQKLGIQLVIPLVVDGGDGEKKRNRPLLAGRLEENKDRENSTLPKDESKSKDQKDNHPPDAAISRTGEDSSGRTLENHPKETDKDLDQEAADALLQDARDSHDSSTNGKTNFSSRGNIVIPAVTTKYHDDDDGNNHGQNVDDGKDENDEAVKYKRDLQHRAQDLDVTSDAYISVPISEFGAAMLRGMGWKGDDDDDVNHKNGPNQTPSSSGVLPRPHRLGLGATPLPPSMKHSKKNGGGDGIGGGKRHWKGGKGGTMSDIAHVQREKEEEERWRQHMLEKKKRDMQLTLQVGSIIRVRKEYEKGDVLCHDDEEERAKVIQTAGVPGLNRILIQYERDEKPTAVKKSSVVLVDRSELENNPFEEEEEEEESKPQRHKPERTIESQRDEQQGKRNHHREDTDSRHRHRHHHRHHEEHDKNYKDNHRLSSKRRHEKISSSHNASSRKDKDSRRDTHKRPHHEISKDHQWLIPNIRVRVVTKKIAKGRQFREKGVVLDVLKRGMEATIQMSNGDILERVPERYLETALPKAGGNVIVLTGSHKYEKGKLLERNSDKGRGVVQLYEDMNVVTLSLDDIAEYCAPLDDTLGDY